MLNCVQDDAELLLPEVSSATHFYLTVKAALRVESVDLKKDKEC